MCRSGLCTSTPAGGCDVGGGDGAGALLAQVHDDRLVVLGGDDELLDVQDELGDVLLDARRRCVNSCRTPSIRMLVTAAPGMRRQQGAAQRVAEGVAETGLERLEDEPRAELADRLFGEHGTLGDEHVYFLPAAPAI